MKGVVNYRVNEKEEICFFEPNENRAPCNAL